MNIILDIILVGLIGGSAALGYYKGLIKTLFSLVGSLGALVLAVVLNDPFSGLIRDVLFKEMEEGAAKLAAFLVLIVVCYVALFVASHLLDTVFRVLPFGKTLNKGGGIAVGVLRGALFVLILGAVAYYLVQADLWIIAEDVENTVLLREVNQFNPILDFIK